MNTYKEGIGSVTLRQDVGNREMHEIALLVQRAVSPHWRQPRDIFFLSYKYCLEKNAVDNKCVPLVYVLKAT